MNPLGSIALILAWCFIGAGCWLGWQLLRQNGRMLLRLDELQKRLDEWELGQERETEGLALDSAAPEFDLPDLEGTRHTLHQYRGQQVLPVFFNPECGFCREMIPRLARLGHQTLTRGSETPASAGNQSDSARTELTPVVLIITSGDKEKNRQFFAEHNVPFPVLLQKETEVSSAYRANGTPTGYLINKEGKISSELAIGAEALLSLADGKSEIRNP